MAQSFGGFLGGMHHDDVFQEGMIGLWQAAQPWDSKLGSFTTHAVPRIRGQIKDYLRTLPGPAA